MNRHKMLGCVAVLAALLVTVGCANAGDWQVPSYRYKETVVVETPQGIRSGSSVIEVRMIKRDEYGDHSSIMPAAYKGQAVAVDLPNGQKLFALPSSPDYPEWAETAYQYLIPQQALSRSDSYDNSAESRQYRMAMALKGPQVLPRYRGVVGHPGHTESSYPLLVSFKNIVDPTTVEKVDPNNLAATFGSGYKLRIIVFEKTQEPVSSGIERKILWLGKYPESSLRSVHSRDDWSLAATLTHGDFSTFGVYK